MRKQKAARVLGTVAEVAKAWGIKRRLDRALLLGRAYEKCLSCTVEISGRSKVQAGAANTRLGKILLNAALLEPGREADRNATLLHECAHILADSVYRRNCGHGSSWKRVMELLGEKPDVHHALDYLSPKAQAVATWACRDLRRGIPLRAQAPAPAAGLLLRALRPPAGPPAGNRDSAAA